MADKINLTLRKQTWFYSFTIDGERHRGTTGIRESNPDGEHRDRGRALLAAEKIYRQVSRGRQSFIPEQETAAVLFERYITRKVADGLASGTERHYRNYVSKFFNFFPADIKLSVLTPDDMEEWKETLLKTPVRFEGGFQSTGKPLVKKYENRKAKRQANSPIGKKTLSKKTVKECLTFVATVSKYFDLQNPCKNVAMPRYTKIEKQKKLAKKCWNLEQANKVLEYAKEHDKELYWWLMFLILTGCRLGEVKGIRPKDINFEQGTVFVVSGKKDEGRTLSLAAIKVEETLDDDGNLISDESIINPHQSPLFALSVLLHYAKGHYGESFNDECYLYYRYRDWIYEKMRTISKLVEVPVLSPHGLRHSFVTLALSQGHDLAKIAKFAGHKSLSTTFETYAHLSTDIKINLNLGK